MWPRCPSLPHQVDYDEYTKTVQPADVDDLLRPVGTLTEQPAYYEGQAVEVWSSSQSRWIQGEVADVEDDGAFLPNSQSLPHPPTMRKTCPPSPAP